MTAPDLSAPTFDGLAREHPEWKGWLAVMRAALDEAGGPDWRGLTVTPAPARELGSPWLAGASIVADERVASRWMHKLLLIAADSGGAGAASARAAARTAGFDAGAFLRAAVELDTDGLDAVARPAGLSADLARALAHPAALPLLATCAGRPGAVADGWDRGYCPVCGAWPALAELRGLEANRQLRCGRCGADWTAAWLACIYCGNDDHRELGGLVSEAAVVMRRVETCQRCHGYVKSVTTLTARSHAEVMLEDMATVAYDVGALDEGASRPPGLGFPLGAEVSLARPAGLFGRWR